jgi:hypothetical protein
MHFFFVIAGLLLLLLFWRAFAALAVIVVVVAGIVLMVVVAANQPAVPTAQQIQAKQARELAAQQQATAQAAARAAAHEAARPVECTNLALTPAKDTNGTSWVGQADLNYATRCGDWEPNAASVLANTHECHRLPGIWNPTFGMFQDEVSARLRGTYCVLPANPWPTERDAFLTEAERAARSAAKQ